MIECYQNNSPDLLKINHAKDLFIRFGNGKCIRLGMEEDGFSILLVDGITQSIFAERGCAGIKFTRPED